MSPTQKLIIRELLKQGCATQKQLTAATRRIIPIRHWRKNHVV